MGRATATGLLGVAALLLAGCGVIGADVSFGERLNASSDRARELGNVRFETTIDAEDVEQEITGVIDFRSGLTSLTADVPEYGTIEYLYGDDVLYLKSDLLPVVEPIEWLAFEQDQPDASFSYEFVDGAAVFLLLSAASDGVTSLGSDDFRGVEARGYRFELSQETLEESGDWPMHDLPESVTVEAWLDDDKLLRRVTIAIDGRHSSDDAWIEVEFWDYGQAPSVDMPDAATVMDLDDWVDGWETETTEVFDVFESAACYGERLDECLAVNPEVDAMAQDPALCTWLEGRVCLVAIGKVRTDVVQAIVDFHRRTAGIEVVVLPSIAMDRTIIDGYTNQVTEEAVFELMNQHYAATDDAASTYIAITPYDITDAEGDYGWMFGARFGEGAQGLQHGVFSTWRMEHVAPYDGSPITDELVQLRASKYMARYVALLFLDFPAGSDPAYVNYGSMGGFSDLDAMGTTWPNAGMEFPCTRNVTTICIAADNDYTGVLTQQWIMAAADRLSTELGLKVEVLVPAGVGYFQPTLDNWSEEYATDLRGSYRLQLANPNTHMIGISDDPFAQAATVPEHMENYWPGERLAVVSVHSESIGDMEEWTYLLLLRAIAHSYYGVPFDNDPTSLMYSGITDPADLVGKEVPDLLPAE